MCRSLFECDFTFCLFYSEISKKISSTFGSFGFVWFYGKYLMAFKKLSRETTFVTQLTVKYCHSTVMKVRFSNILMTISHNLIVLLEHEKSSGLVLIWKIFSGCRFMFNDLGTPSYLATVQKNLLPFLVNIFISYSTNCGYVFCLLYHCHVMGEICPDMPSYTLDRFISSIFWEYQILCIYTFHYYFSHLILHSRIFWGKW